MEDTKLNFEQMNIIGCKAIAGESITDIAIKYNVDRGYVYKQKERVLKTLEASRNKPEGKEIVLTKIFIARIIIGCMLICKSSTEDCKRFLALVFGISISIGKVSGIINEAAKNAKIWNNSVRLENINIGANDEIFQNSKPILVGVDTRSTYVYLFKATENRDANTWGCSLLDKAENQGLKLIQAVSDSGKGIIRGTKDAFGDDISYQADVFHTVYEFSKGLTSLENYAYRCIEEHEKLLKKSIKNVTLLEQVEKAENKELKAIYDYDRLAIVYSWIRELTEIGGYFYDDRIMLFKFIFEQLEVLNLANNHYLKKSITFIKNNIQQILEFVKVAESNLSKMAVIEGVDEDVLKKLWLQDGYKPTSGEYNYLEAEIGTVLGERYWDVRHMYENFKKDIVRASSIVECINSLIRPYINLKRTIPDNFTDLLQMYFNTRVYRRSRVAERCGKSPYELLTGKKCTNLLDILCPIT